VVLEFTESLTEIFMSVNSGLRVYMTISPLCASRLYRKFSCFSLPASVTKRTSSNTNRIERESVSCNRLKNFPELVYYEEHFRQSSFLEQ
jgi:hypothetical protein